MKWMLIAAVVVSVATGCDSGDCTCKVIDEILSGDTSDKLSTLEAIEADKLLLLDSCASKASELGCFAKSFDRLLAQGEPAAVRRAVIAAAAARGMQGYIPHAERLLASDDEKDIVVGLRAAEKLQAESVEAHALRLLDSKHVEVRTAAARVAEDRKLAAAGRKLLALYPNAPTGIADDSHEGSYYLSAMGAIDPGLLVEALDGASSDQQSAIVYELQLTEDTGALVAALSKTSERAKASLISHLQSEKVREAVPALIELLPHDDNVRIVAIRALGGIGDPSATQPLLDLLANLRPGKDIAHPSLRGVDGVRDVVEALVAIGDQDAIDKAHAQVTAWTKRGPKKQREAAAAHLSARMWGQ